MSHIRSAVVVAEFRAEMGRQQLTVQELATRVGLHPTTVSMKVRGRRALSLDEFFILADALRLDKARLVQAAAGSLSGGVE
ncbi:MAG: helix-turn-helix domain-containing protein [Propionibacteriaceae bacterium]|jgi:transcriptional regulator with XRE-family HTH domain|nr:helix-turn-helix domain-containing protein [Propionibacteriaceae bacterium]